MCWCDYLSRLFTNLRLSTFLPLKVREMRSMNPAHIPPLLENIVVSRNSALFSHSLSSISHHPQAEAKKGVGGGLGDRSRDNIEFHHHRRRGLRGMMPNTFRKYRQNETGGNDNYVFE